MFQVIFLVGTSFALTAAVQFEDCATDKSNTAITVHELDFSPSPVIIPGELHTTINLTVNQQISLLFVDVILEKQTLGIWTKLPCIQNIGTCSNIDACTILETILNGSSVLSKELGLQIDAILASALGHKASCPIQPENVYINNAKVMLQPIPSALASTLLNGHYRMTIAVKNDPTTTDNIGCMRFEADIHAANDAGPIG